MGEHGRSVMRPWLILVFAVVLAVVAVAARIASWMFAGLAVVFVAAAVVTYLWRRNRRHGDS